MTQDPKQRDPFDYVWHNEGSGWTVETKRKYRYETLKLFVDLAKQERTAHKQTQALLQEAVALLKDQKYMLCDVVLHQEQWEGNENVSTRRYAGIECAHCFTETEGVYINGARHCEDCEWLRLDNRSDAFLAKIDAQKAGVGK